MDELVRRYLIGFLAWLDVVVYNIIEIFYNLLMEIAKATPFSNQTFAEFADRIYALLGLFMLFKVSFSLIKYIVNPDEFSDKVKGGKKLVMNILIVLVLIVVTPMGFRYMDQFQTELLKQDVLGKIIFGKGVGESKEKVDKASLGSQVKVQLFSAFYAPDASADDACNLADPSKTSDYQTACSSLMSSDGAKAYAEAYQSGDVSRMFFDKVGSTGDSLLTLKKASGSGWAINYMFLISTAVGILVALLFLNFCFDIAVRMVKLGFLQLISPIPIVSYIDPNSGKNGMFSKWLKEVGKTFIDLFIRLGAVYLAITLIAELWNNFWNGDLGTDSRWAAVFIMIGILLFANQIPKLLSDLLGVKLDGSFSLNPMKKVTASPLASAVVGGAAGLVGGGIANAAGKLKDPGKDKNGQDITGGRAVIHAVGSGVGGALLGGLKSGYAGLTGGGKASPLKNAANVIERNSKIRNYNAQQGGFISGTRSRITDRATTLAGIKYSSGSTSEVKSKIQMKQNQLANAQLQERALEEARLRLVNEQGAATGGLLKTFDYAVKEYDEKGRIKSYAQKDYTQYLMSETRKIVEAGGGNWDAMSQDDRKRAADWNVSEGKVVTKEVFTQINDLYVAKGEQDLLEASLKKEITELEESRDLGKNLRPKQ